MKSLITSRWLAGLFVLAVSSVGFAQEITVTPQRESGVYTVGDSIEWIVEAKEPTYKGQIPYVLKANGGKTIQSGKLDIQDGRGTLNYVATETGALLAEFTTKAADGKNARTLGGAIVDPAKIQKVEKAPANFDAFWQKQIAELKKIPAKPVLTSGQSDKPGVIYNKITMDNIRGTHIQGQIARPEKGEKFPALLQVQWAGVYPLAKNWVTGRAAQGWLALNIQAHDIAIDETAEYYDKLKNGDLKGYTGIGNTDKETCYFLRMYLSGYQALEYLTHRPDWDGKTLVVMGTSQGGMQTLVLAGLHPQVTAAMAMVPAGCGLLDGLHDRDAGWPKWPVSSGENAAAIIETARYYDAVNFASHIQVPTLIGVGAIDTTCPPAGVISAFNEINAPKELLIMPLSGHQNSNGSQNAYGKRLNEWLDVLSRGNPAPVRK